MHAALQSVWELLKTQDHLRSTPPDELQTIVRNAVLQAVRDDSSSPFYLHPSENPSLVLVTSLLTGMNYHTWSRAMRMALLLKNKLKFVDGTIPVPARDDAVQTCCFPGEMAR